MVCCLNVVPVRAQVQAPAATTGSVAQRSKGPIEAVRGDMGRQAEALAGVCFLLGDKRYNDQLSDYSTQEVNASLARGRAFIQRLSEIDTTGLAGPGAAIGGADAAVADRRSGGREVQGVADAGEPVQRLPLDAAATGRTICSSIRVKDYDDYIARLKKVPTAFSQITTNMELGIDEGRMPPQYLMEKVSFRRRRWHEPEAGGESFALPLKKFPKTRERCGPEADFGRSCWMRLGRRCCRPTSGSRSF